MYLLVEIQSLRSISEIKFHNFTESTNLTNAITITGEAYEDIAKMYDDQPKNDWEPLGDTMHDFKGILAGWPGILQIHSVRIIQHFLLFS